MRFGYSLLALATLGGGGTTFALSSKSSFNQQQKTITTKDKVVTPSRESQFEVSEPVVLTKPQIAESESSPQDQGISVITSSLSAQENVETAETSAPQIDSKPLISHHESSTTLQQFSDSPNQLPNSPKEISDDSHQSRAPLPQMSDSLPQTSDLPSETLDSLGQSHPEEEPHKVAEALPDAIEDDVGDVGNCQFISFKPKSNIPSDFKITDEGYFSVDCKNEENNILSPYDWIGFFPKSFFGINWRNIENKRISIQIEDKEELVTEEEEEVYGIKISSPKLLGGTFMDAKLNYHSWEEEEGEGNWTKIESTSKKDQKIYLLLKEEGAEDEAQ